jgi:hypothetical protein
MLKKWTKISTKYCCRSTTTPGVAPAADDEFINAPVLDIPVDDDDINVETVRAMECSCVDDPANEIAEFDDSAEYDDGVNPDERGGDREGGHGVNASSSSKNPVSH